MAGMVQLRNDTEGRAYYRRKLQQSKTSMEAMRCLRRRLSDVVYRQLAADAALRAHGAGRPGRALGDDSEIQRGRPDPGHRLFGPATSRTRTLDATPARRPPKTPPGLEQAPYRDDAPEVSTWSAPPDERR